MLVRLWGPGPTIDPKFGGGGYRSSSTQTAASVERDRSPTLDETADVLSEDLCAPAVREASALVAPQQRLHVRSGREQGRVDVELAAELCDPGADQGDRRTQIPVDVARRGDAQAVPREREPFGHRGEQFAGNRPSEMALIEPAHAAERFEIRRWTLRDADQGQIGQDEPNRLIELGGSALTPRGDGLCDAHGATAELTRLLDLPPRLLRVARHRGPAEQFRALVFGPRLASVAGESLDQPATQRKEIRDVGGRVLLLIAAQGPAQPIGQAVALGESHGQDPLDECHQRRVAVSRETGRDLGVVHVRREGPAGSDQDLEVLRRGMHDDRCRPGDHGP